MDATSLGVILLVIGAVSAPVVAGRFTFYICLTILVGWTFCTTQIWMLESWAIGVMITTILAQPLEDR
jgi:hypothetical protein